MSHEKMDVFWSCADSPVPVPVLTGDDVASLDHQTFEYLKSSGLLRPGNTSGHVVCRECGEDHHAEASSVAYPGGKTRFYMVCPLHGRLEVARERLLQWTVVFEPVLSALMTGLGSVGTPKEVVPGRVWNLGRTALNGRSRTLWAVRGLAWQDASVVADSVPKGRSPVVFVLGMLHENVLEVPGDCIIELRTVLEATSTGFVASKDSVESQLGATLVEPRKKKPPKRATRAATIDAIKKLLQDHLRDARDYAYRSQEREDVPKLLPRPTQEQIAERLNVSVSSVSRAINDRADLEIKYLWDGAVNIDQVMKFNR
jgi:hypothetical protein